MLKSLKRSEITNKNTKKKSDRIVMIHNEEAQFTMLDAAGAGVSVKAIFTASGLHKSDMC